MFKENLKKGQEGEIKVIYSLQEKGLEVKDYTNYTTYKVVQQKGYDIEVKNIETNEWDRVEIKSNSKNGYVYLETKSNQNLGWFWTSSSDLIYHFDLKKEEIYGYELKKMRNFVYKNKLNPNHGRFKNLIGIKIEENKLIQKI